MSLHSNFAQINTLMEYDDRVLIILLCTLPALQKQMSLQEDESPQAYPTTTSLPRQNTIGTSGVTAGANVKKHSSSSAPATNGTHSNSTHSNTNSSNSKNTPSKTKPSIASAAKGELGENLREGKQWDFLVLLFQLLPLHPRQPQSPALLLLLTEGSVGHCWALLRASLKAS